MVWIYINTQYSIDKLTQWLLVNNVCYAYKYSDVVTIYPSVYNLNKLKSLWFLFPVPIVNVRLSNTIKSKTIIENYNTTIGQLRPHYACLWPYRSIREDIEYSEQGYRKHWKVANVLYK